VIRPTSANADCSKSVAPCRVTIDYRNGVLPGDRAAGRHRVSDALDVAGDQRSSTSRYDDCMKRLTVSLPNDLVDKIKQAAGGEGQVSSYVATALADYQEQESLDELLAAWLAESPVPDEVQQHVEAELDGAGLTAPTQRSSRIAG